MTPERFNSPSALYQHDLEKDERQVAEWYNTLSNSYDELYGQEQSQKYEIVFEFLGNRHFRILVDIGCGTGTFLDRAHVISDHSIGIDLSPKMLKIAKNKRTPNADYVLASSSSLPLKTDSSDCTVSISTAKADPNLPKFLADVERICREGSFLAVTLFQEPGAPNPISMATSVRSTKISERETLYFRRPAETLK
jgi:ubiquinone/menaquinone biosynthesis C-methylase UbiE